MDASHIIMSYTLKLRFILHCFSEEQPSLDNEAPCYIMSASGELNNNFPEWKILLF